MGVTIDFRGVSLFVIREGALDEVLIPNAEREPPWVGTSNPWKHPDNSIAVRHFAGLAIRRAGWTHTANVSLHGQQVVIGAGTTKPRVDQSADDAFAHLDKVIGSVADISPPTSAIGASVKVRGESTLVAHAPARFPFNLAGTTLTHLSPRLQFDASKVDVRIGSQCISVDEGDTVVIYNFEAPAPSIEDLEKEEVKSCMGHITGGDFRWLYSLLRPHSGTSWPPVTLPVPRLDCSTIDGSQKFFDPSLSLLAVSISTCFPGLWHQGARSRLHPGDEGPPIGARS